MLNRRRDEWNDERAVYTAGQVERILDYCGVRIEGETGTHFTCLCPFHGNTDSPALVVDKTIGVYLCFNPSCEATGDIRGMLKSLKGLNHFQAYRIIKKYENSSESPLEDRVRAVLVEEPEYPFFPQEVLDKMKADFPGSVGEEYMRSRGFDDDTLDYFDVGFSASKNMVAVPMHDPKGNPVGVIGRTPSHTEKVFKNSVNLPKSKTAWNFHRAKKTGETVIVCEASYDAMRIHQAGFPNVIALLGGHLTDYHVNQIGKHFSTVIIMTDFDKKQYRPNCRPCRSIDFARNEVRCVGHRPGRELGRSIATKLSHKRILWGVYDDTCVLPHNAKDASDMTDEEIRQCLKSPVSNVEYLNSDFEKVLA